MPKFMNAMFTVTLIAIGNITRVLNDSENNKYRCNRPDYTPGWIIPGYIMA